MNRKREYQLIEKLVSRLAGAIPVFELDRRGIDAVQISRKIQIKSTKHGSIYLRNLLKYDLDIEIYVCFKEKVKNRWVYTIYHLVADESADALCVESRYLWRDSSVRFGGIFFQRYPFSKKTYKVELVYERYNE